MRLTDDQIKMARITYTKVVQDDFILDLIDTIEALQQENEQLKEQINTAKIGWDTYKTYSEQLEQQTAESNKIIETQRQEIDQLKELLADWKYNTKCDADHIAALTADKDEQAGRIMEQDTLLKESRDLFNAVRGILKDVGRLFQASQKQVAATATMAFIIIIDALNKKIDALLGGAKDGN